MPPSGPVTQTLTESRPSTRSAKARVSCHSGEGLEALRAELAEAQKKVEQKEIDLGMKLLDLEQQAAQARADLGRAQLKAEVPAEVQQRIELERALLDKKGREQDLQNLEAEGRVTRALTGAELPARPYDGLDISRLLTGEVDRIGGQGKDGEREIVFWQQDGVGGLRSGRWKYLRPGLWSGTPTLFDLEADPGEKNDLYVARPELARELEGRLKELIGG